ncbi:pantothenate synthase [Scheffersomyces stipitis CBS 6054]|uniref:Pantoate--beta-alanine ligase n=1 Tax=Scheffersomyces stipitis (strain ATCC 58785 / CBS 6054 / NBRC 10063 / NRRL Y-11545) TaxID=322104 RepID=A3LQZ2_PICST|nr:pantothenate synthase [Scheffersomyces stipitis CBS 6054]ABN65297.1 pantothenate synthase [Scheffersomyces stipitis CBS 6054]
MTVSNSIKIFRTVQQVRQWRQHCLLNRETVGFIPTMGALHDGHCTLVNQSLKDNDRTVVSIFVNPSQFAPHEDLDAYPRTVDTDMKLLSQKFVSKPVDAVFIPKITEMYPSGITLDVANQRGAFVTVHGCSEQLEGVTRPQFFRGVATVVTKLLNIVTPDRVYFGQKDAQQCVVIKNLVRDLLINTEVKVLPTLREQNGLAMSSRNAYLSDSTKQESAVIYQGLTAGATFYEQQKDNGAGKVSSAEILDKIKKVYTSNKDFEVEYIAVSHPETLDDLEYVVPGTGAIISTAVRVPKEDGSGVARLIDNVVLV